MKAHEDILSSFEIPDIDIENIQGLQTSSLDIAEEVISKNESISDTHLQEEVYKESEETSPLKDILSQESKNTKNSEIAILEASTTLEDELGIDSEASKQKTKRGRFLSTAIFICKYIFTSSCIFAVLLGIANFSAYSNIVYSFLYAEEMQEKADSIQNSVAGAQIVKEEDMEVDTFKHISKEEETVEAKTEYVPSMHSLGKLIAKTESQTIDLGIEITPYENRVVIPKIGKNIPLIEIKEQKVEGVQELNDIFMKELENGIIRYPGSAKPGENGNSFIFGHSSNLPWLDGDYNDVFALLDNVEFDDEVIVYYGQEKYTYKIEAKNVIRPGDVSVLQSNSNDDKSQITLMTCWPIGTTLNRLVLTGELISIEK